MRNGHDEVYGYAFWVNQCTSGFHRVFVGRCSAGPYIDKLDDRGVSDQKRILRGSFPTTWEAVPKRKLSRCAIGIKWVMSRFGIAGRRAICSIIMKREARDLEACLEKGRGIACTVATTEVSYEGWHGNVMGGRVDEKTLLVAGRSIQRVRKEMDKLSINGL
ncbi:hypothetical protein Tco_0687897 [Tanacetum coccineum]